MKKQLVEFFHISRKGFLISLLGFGLIIYYGEQSIDITEQIYANKKIHALLVDGTKELKSQVELCLTEKGEEQQACFVELIEVIEKKTLEYEQNRF